MHKLLIVAFTAFCIGTLLGTLMMKSCTVPCPEAIITKQWADTSRPDVKTVVPQVTETKPVPRTITRRKTDLRNSAFSPAGGDSGLISVSRGGDLHTTPTTTADCSEMVEYSDTLHKPDAYTAILYEVVSENKIQHRSIRFYNLTPTITQHTEKIIPQRERVKVYAGAFSGFGRNYTGGRWNWSIGPEVMVSVPFGLMAGYGFDAKNNMHQVQLLYKIKLRK